METEQSAPPGVRPPRAGRRRWPVWLVAVAVVVGLVAGGLEALLAYNRARTDETLARAEREIHEQANVGSWPEAKRALDQQAAALVRGDENGWLAAVDPQHPDLREQYRRIYANLRQLGVTGWTYNVRFPAVTAYGRPELNTPVTVSYCLQTSSCPAYDQGRPPSAQAVASLEQQLSMTRRGGAYVITAMRPVDGANPLNLPWLGKLVFAQGKRVTVAAPPSQARRLPEVVAVADRAAAVADRYARYVGDPQRRYRVYMAGDKEWKTWFYGPPRINAIGYAIPLGLASTEVVLRMDDLHGAGLLKTTRHELGHVVTLAGSDQRYSAVYDVHEWLVEGVAEYIGFAPRPPSANPRDALVRSARRLPDTMAVPPLTDKSSSEQVNLFYGLGHHAVSCMVDGYGERAFFTFFKRVVREGASYAEASQEVYGRPWQSVDRDCVAAIHRGAR